MQRRLSFILYKALVLILAIFANIPICGTMSSPSPIPTSDIGGEMSKRREERGKLDAPEFFVTTVIFNEETVGPGNSSASNITKDIISPTIIRKTIMIPPTPAASSTSTETTTTSSATKAIVETSTATSHILTTMATTSFIPLTTRPIKAVYPPTASAPPNITTELSFENTENSEILMDSFPFDDLMYTMELTATAGTSSSVSSHATIEKYKTKNTTSLIPHTTALSPINNSRTTEAPSTTRQTTSIALTSTSSETGPSTMTTTMTARDLSNNSSIVVTKAIKGTNSGVSPNITEETRSSASSPQPVKISKGIAVLNFKMQSSDPMDDSRTLDALLKKACSIFLLKMNRRDILLTWGQDRTSVDCDSILDFRPHFHNTKIPPSH